MKPKMRSSEGKSTVPSLDIKGVYNEKVEEKVEPKFLMLSETGLIGRTFPSV